MSERPEADYYEALEVSPRADTETIERVFRHLAKRFHPDNAETGDGDRFSEIVAAYRTLSNPELRARYDAGYTELQRRSWQIFDQASATSNVETDKRIRTGIMTVLYQARRRDVDRPGVGQLELERILDCPQEVMKFHIWYMKESGWIQRLDTGLLAITYKGINELHDQQIPWADEAHRLSAVSGERVHTAGSGSAGAAGAADAGGGDGAEVAPATEPSSGGPAPADGGQAAPETRGTGYHAPPPPLSQGW